MPVIHRVEDEVKLLELSITDDKFKLFARVEPRDKYYTITVEQMLQEIAAISPAELIERDVVYDLVEQLQKGNGCDARRVAQGRLPGDGRDGKVVWLARRFCASSKYSTGREFSDFFTLGLFENIEVGTEIARIYKPTPGTPGIDVQGKEVTAKAGKPVSVKWDKSIELRTDPQHENYTTAVSLIAGYIHDEGTSVAVRDTLTVPGNLDWEFGHIDFVGNVVVGGDVQKGFHIKARGDITIKGGLIGDNVLTSQRSIVVKGCHVGTTACPVTAVGDYTVGVAHGVSATVGGAIYIEREARDCAFSAGLAVYAPKAVIVGGSIWCVDGLETKTLGNEGGVQTVVEIKNELEVTKEYRKIAVSISKHEAAIAALELHIGPYLKSRQRVPLLRREFRLKITALLEKYDGIVASLARLRKQEQEVREAKPPKLDARVSVSGVVHAGVVLTLGEARLDIKESVKGPISFRRADHQPEWVMEKFQSVKKG